MPGTPHHLPVKAHPWALAPGGELVAVLRIGPAPIIFRPIFNPSQEGGTKKPKKAGRDSRIPPIVRNRERSAWGRGAFKTMKATKSGLPKARNTRDIGHEGMASQRGPVLAFSNQETRPPLSESESVSHGPQRPAGDGCRGFRWTNVYKKRR